MLRRAKQPFRVSDASCIFAKSRRSVADVPHNMRVSLRIPLIFPPLLDVGGERVSFAPPGLPIYLEVAPQPHTYGA
jgi:hypothetical protein